jgi:quercetin dioxygenase-like cupin family protein
MNPEQALTGGSVRVLGDQSKPGMYIYRNRFAPGNTSRPHYHDQDRYVTVIKGTWWTGEGDVFQPDKMVPIKPGGFMFHPAGLHHYDGAKDEEVIVQIMGMGPVKTVQTEVDEKGNPVTGRGATGTEPNTRQSTPR